MSGFIRSDPRFFTLVKRAMAALTVALVVAAALIDAPLDLAADPAHAPNPARSAWFLLWIQELVSHSTFAIYIVVVMASLLVALPWLPLAPRDTASWFPRAQRAVSALVLLAVASVLALTVVAICFRGENWRAITPF